ncbi:MAG: nucleotidyltransferase domain-containing protein [Ignavibacteria bacterium]|jgi:predicted nucleotidyltransferase
MNTGIINKIAEYFSDKPVKKVFLFGSFARQDNDESSDVDLLVELDSQKTVGLEFVKMKLDLEELLNKKVDLLTDSSISKYIKPFFETDRVLIYEKQLG